MFAIRRAVVLPALLAVGCAANPAPYGWLPKAEGLTRSTRGAWVVVTTRNDGVSRGELIAVSDSQLHVLTHWGLRTLATSDVVRASAALYEPETAGSRPLIFLTHGWYMPLTLPMWIAVSSAASHAPLIDARRPSSLAALAKYARFPQGLPSGLDPAALGDVLEHTP